MTQTRIGDRLHPASGVNHPEVHPDAPTGGGGPGHFRTRKSRMPMGFVKVKADACHLGPTAGTQDARYCEEVKPGTKEQITDVESGIRILVERQKNGLYHWLIETLDGNQSCEGVHDPATEFSGEICVDITSKAALRALEETVSATKKKVETKQVAPEEVVQEIILITIIKDDWLTKISRKRWGTDDWERHLAPTQETLDRRTQKGQAFDPNLIYPGDTFEVIP
jgi:hypothetical protein